jgi:spermidine/putrescine-binding protein
MASNSSKSPKAIAIKQDAKRITTLKWLFAAAGVAAAIALAGAAHAATSHDGNWKVTIITESGNCDPAYSYPVKVVGGKVSYNGDGSFQISGNVADAGAVNVSIARGEQKANASGKISGNAGAGQWSGKSSSTNCAGRWEASKS